MKSVFYIAALLTLSTSVSLVNEQPLSTVINVNEAISCYTDTIPHHTGIPHNFVSAQYRDIRTGQIQPLYYDTQRNMLFDRSTGMPVSVYSNAVTGDTISRAGNYVINHYLFVHPEQVLIMDTSQLRLGGHYLIIRGNTGIRREASWQGRQHRQ